MELRARYIPSQPVWSGKDALPCQAIETIPTGLWNESGGPTAVVHSLELEQHHQRYHEKLCQQMDHGDCQRGLHMIGSMTTSQHMSSEPCQPHGLTTVRWRYLTFCQLHFGGRQESCKIPIEETWHVLLMGCLLWFQWWSHNKSWIQDISHLHSLHHLHAATATTFLMKITCLLACIFMYGTE